MSSQFRVIEQSFKRDRSGAAGLAAEWAARVECRAALLSDQIIDLDAVVERMEVGTVPCSNRVPLFSFFFRGNSFLMFLPLQLTTFFQMTSVVIPSHVLRRRC